MRFFVLLANCHWKRVQWDIFDDLRWPRGNLLIGFDMYFFNDVCYITGVGFDIVNNRGMLGLMMALTNRKNTLAAGL